MAPRNNTTAYIGCCCCCCWSQKWPSIASFRCAPIWTCTHAQSVAAPPRQRWCNTSFRTTTALPNGHTTASRRKKHMHHGSIGERGLQNSHYLGRAKGRGEDEHRNGKTQVDLDCVYWFARARAYTRSHSKMAFDVVVATVACNRAATLICIAAPGFCGPSLQSAEPASSVLCDIIIYVPSHNTGAPREPRHAKTSARQCLQGAFSAEASKSMNHVSRARKR